jgi:hypothetical protein
MCSNIITTFLAPQKQIAKQWEQKRTFQDTQKAPKMTQLAEKDERTNQ